MQSRRLTRDEATSAGGTVRVRWFRAAVVWLIVLGLGLYFFSATKYIVLGLLGAGCLASALWPLMQWLKGPRWLRAALAGMVPLVVVAAFGGLIWWALRGRLQEQLERWPQFQEKVNALLGRWGSWLSSEGPLTLSDLGGQAGELLTGSGGRQLFSTAASVITGTGIALAFLFFGSIFMLGEKRQTLLDPVLALLPARRRPQFTAALEDLAPRLRWWLIGTMISMVVVGIASAIGYSIIGLEMALGLALLAGLSEVVPTFGPLVTFLLALLAGAAQGGGAVAGVIVVYLVVQVLESYILIPLVMKEAVKMPPLVTLFSVVLWGQVFGAPGLLLAIPINLTIWSFADHMLIRPGRGIEGSKDGGIEG